MLAWFKLNHYISMRYKIDNDLVTFATLYPFWLPEMVLFTKHHRTTF
jgi:hypothetical protein